MTASRLIEEIFARRQHGLADDFRYISERQYFWLRDLIEAEGSHTCVIRMPQQLTWSPEGRDKYILRENQPPGKFSVERVANLRSAGALLLFGEPVKSNA